MLVSIISLVILMICISMIKNFTGCDKRVLYITEKDLDRFINMNELEETKKEIFVL